MLKIAGICILIFTICYISKSLCDRRRRALRIYEELSGLLHFIKRSIGCYLMPLCDIAAHFEAATLDRMGFLKMLRDGCSGADALKRSGVDKELDPESARLLCSFFDSFGTGYLEDEIRLVSSVSEELDKRLSDERRRAPEKVRLLGTLSAAASLALLILIL